MSRGWTTEWDPDRPCVAPTKSGRLCNGRVWAGDTPPLCRNHWWMKDEYTARPWTLEDTKRMLAEQKAGTDG